MFLGGGPLNIPNILTTVRFLLVPVFAYFIYEGQYILSVIILTIAGITDFLDGHIARKYNMITSWGKLADPLADKFMQLTALIILAIKDKIPLYAVAIILLKEILMVAGSILLLKQDEFVVSANWYGKVTTVILYLAVILIMLNITLGNYLLLAALVATIFSFVNYGLIFIRIKTGHGSKQTVQEDDASSGK